MALTTPTESVKYEYQPYPKMIYYPDGSSKIVHDDEEFGMHRSIGWSESPVEFSHRVALEAKIKIAEQELKRLRENLAKVKEEEGYKKVVEPPETKVKKAGQ